MDDEPQYVDDPFDDDEWSPHKRPKWMSPSQSRPIEKRILEAVGRKYYPDRAIRSEIIKIAKGSMSLDSGVVSEYPTEWIEFCCEWAESKRAKGSIVQLKGLVTFINRKEARQEFIDDFKEEYDDDFDFLFDDEDAYEDTGFRG